MPLGASRITLLSKSQVTAAAEVIRKQVGIDTFGNAQTDTAISQFGGSSLLLDGTGDYLSSPINSSFGFGTGNFTIECWIRPTSTSGTRQIIDFRNASGSDTAVTLYVASGGQIRMYTAGADRITGSTLSVDTWYHVALSRSGTSTKLFVDGTQVGSTYTDSNDYGTSKPMTVGARYDGSINYFVGNIDEVRVSNSARYTGSFTPSTTALVNDDNTKLLLHMDGTDGNTYFPDDNGVGRAACGLSAIGNAQIDTAQSKFGGGSVQMDGSGDGVLMKGPFDFSTDFTAEAFIRHNTVSVTQLYFRLTAPNDTFIMWFGIQGSTNKIGVYKGGFTVGTTALSTNTWYHVAMEYENSSGACRFYLDGVYQGTRTITAPGTVQVYMGSPVDSTLNGYMDEVRITSGKRYDVGTGNFTAPSEPFVNDTDTLALVHCDGTDTSTDLHDDNGVRARYDATSLNGAQIDTAQSYFGNSSLLMDGTDDYVVVNNALGQLDLGSGTDFTVEFWYRPNSLPGSGLEPLINYGNTLFYLGYSGGTEVYDVFVGGASRVTLNTISISNGNWYHVAFVRVGSNITVYHNGTSVTTGTHTWNPGVSDVQIGKYSTYYFNGHMDEIRVSKSARYTSGFSVPTEPFQNDADTLFLYHFDGDDGSTVFRDDNGPATDYAY